MYIHVYTYLLGIGGGSYHIFASGLFYMEFPGFGVILVWAAWFDRVERAKRNRAFGWGPILASST